MPLLLDAPPVGAALFHCRAGGFPLLLCSYALLDAGGLDTESRERVTVVQVTALTGERFRLRDPEEIRRFLAAVGRTADEVPS